MKTLKKKKPREYTHENTKICEYASENATTKTCEYASENATTKNCENARENMKKPRIHPQKREKTVIMPVKMQKKNKKKTPIRP